MSGFYLSWLKASPRPLVYKQWAEGRRTRKLNYLVELPVFDISGLQWIGASYIATEFWGTVSGTFSFRKLVVNDPSVFNFFLCVRTPQRNSDGLGVTRYKLWSPLENVRLETFPVYSEQRLDPSFVIEVWTLPSSTRVNLDTVLDLIISLILDPSSCCDDSNPVVTLTEHCDLWAIQNGSGNYDLPIQFNTCFNAIVPPPAGETFYRIIENGDIRSNEIGDHRVYI